MLPKQFMRLDEACRPVLHRFLNGREVTHEGGCPLGAEMTVRVELPRTLGAAAVVMRVGQDGREDRDIPLSFVSVQQGVECYEGVLRTGELLGTAVSQTADGPSADAGSFRAGQAAGEEHVADGNTENHAAGASAGETAGAEEGSGGLIFWELLFVRGEQTLFSDSVDNLHFSLSPHSGRRFLLVVWAPPFRTPSWLGEGTMYHIFLDRFCRGEGEVRLRPGALENRDWENGVPQFAPRPGDPLPNNVFFGGNLWGVAEKLDFLASLGVTVLYLSPVFDAASNHRYDTGDYERVDAYLGGDKAFARLISEAHSRGMRVVLDGVFNHTGSDSRYFNREGHYPDLGAYQSQNSPYAGWYRFRQFPDDYECWWGIRILPRLNQQNPDCRRYFTSPGGIACRWLRLGADGWRLDVADELPDVFLDELRRAVKAQSGGEAALIGEVWENAADKTAYGQRRRYLQGGQLDSVMNYPFREAVLCMLCRGDTERFVRTVTEIYATYPRQVSDSLMNLLGTHDTPRILTLLGEDGAGQGKTNAELAALRLTPAQRARALRLLELAAVLQFTVYGFPSVYYGDEAGMEGYGDPFCRRPYPWGREESALLAHYRALGQLRRSCPALHGGDFRVLAHAPGSFLYERSRDGCRLLVAVNLSVAPVSYRIPGQWKHALSGESTEDVCTVRPGGWAVLLSRPEQTEPLKPSETET